MPCLQAFRLKRSPETALSAAETDLSTDPSGPYSPAPDFFFPEERCSAVPGRAVCLSAEIRLHGRSYVRIGGHFNLTEGSHECCLSASCRLTGVSSAECEDPSNKQSFRGFLPAITPPPPLREQALHGIECLLINDRLAPSGVALSLVVISPGGSPLRSR